MYLLQKIIILLLFLAPLSSAHAHSLDIIRDESASSENVGLRFFMLTPEQQAFLDDHPVLRVGNEMDWAPYDFVEHGTPAGYAIDHIRLLADYLGLELEFVNGYTWSQLLELFEAKKIDVMPVMYRNVDRARYTAFTEPYANTNLVVVVRSRTNDVHSLADLAGKKVALQRNDGFIPGIKDNISQENLLLFPNYLEALLAVSTGKADVCIGSSMMTYYLVNNEQITNLKVVDYIIQDKNQETNSFLHIGVRNDWTTLRDILDRTMAAVPSEERQALNLRWFHNILPEEQVRARDLILTREEQTYLQEKKTIRISVDPDWLPFDQIDSDGVHCGVGAELVRAMERRLGINVELVPTSTWAESVENIKAGRCDMLPLAMDVPSRRAYLDFTTPFLVQPFVVATRADSSFIQDTEDILDMKVGMVTSYAHREKFRLKYPDLQVVDVDSAADGLHRLHSGELDGYVDSLAAIGYRMQTESLIGLKIAGTLDLDLELSIATRKDDPMLGKIAQKCIDSIAGSEKRAMVNTWLVVTPENRTDYSLAWKILGVAVLLLFASYLWNRRLARLNHELVQAHEKLDAQSRELKKLSRTDALTQLPNRGRLDDVFAYELERCRRFKRVFSIILIDVDYFKNINDTFGHHAGDQLLVELAGLLKENCRKSDTIGRWGGEEFLVICPELVADQAATFAEKLRRVIATHSFAVGSQQTCSFGVATYMEDDDTLSLFNSVDEALYRAKEKGRNRVEK